MIKMRQNRFRPLAELTTLPQTP